MSFLVFIAWEKLEQVEYSFSVLVSTSFPLILLVGFLAVLNLSTEAMKFNKLSGITELDFYGSFRSVLAGMSIGIFTPNRIGEVFGRIKLFPKGTRKRAAAASITGSFIQGLVTMIFGFFGLYLFPLGIGIPSLGDYYFLLITGIIGFAILFVFFNQNRWLTSFSKFFSIEKRMWLSGAMWAILRYFIFSSQFVILLFSFGFQGSIIEAYSGVFLLYFIQTFIPGSFLSELGVREVLSVLLFAKYFDQAFAAPLAAFILWCLNIGLPILLWNLFPQQSIKA